MRRRWFLLGSFGLFIFALWVLGAGLGELVPSEGGRRLAREFIGAALQPALDYEEVEMREVAQPFSSKVAQAAWMTVKYAVVAMSFALVLGLVGGVLGSRAWWVRPSRGLETLRLLVRLLATALRSVHELLWAILFLSAVGTSPLAAMLAMALPYGGTLAKVFSELLDEANAGASEVMRSAGGSGFSAFLGTVVGALPDLLTYAMYRLECAVRSSAILGFVGVPTLGYEIKVSFDDGHYHEIWTYVFVLLVIVLSLEWWGGKIRQKLVSGVPARLSADSDDLPRLWRKRGKSLFLKASGVLVIGLIAMGWLLEDDWGSSLTMTQRWENFQRFSSELVPYPVQESGDWREAPSWLGQLMKDKGCDALWRTFLLGSAAALLAGGTALLGLPWSNRSLATGQPRGVPVGRGWMRKFSGLGLRLMATLGRSAPEYLLAFLLLQIFGPTMWALILALAIHNGGILSRLGGEVVDNNKSRAAEVLLGSGASREATFVSCLLPDGFNRMLLFLFYRWETCIREATVLGMLGVGSLGFLISGARVSFYYDELVVWIALGAVLVFAGDLASDFFRGRLRKSY